MDFTAIASVLTAAGVGSVIGTVVAQSKDRRAQRAAVLEAAAVVSRLLGRSVARGANVTTLDEKELAAALGRMRSAAVVAGLPRAVVEQYEIAAWAIAYMKRYPALQGRDDRILRHHFGVLEDLLVSHAWHPWWAPIRRMGVLRKAMKEIHEAERVDDIVNTAMWEARPTSAEQPTRQPHHDD